MNSVYRVYGGLAMWLEGEAVSGEGVVRGKSAMGLSGCGGGPRYPMSRDVSDVTAASAAATSVAPSSPRLLWLACARDRDGESQSTGMEEEDRYGSE